MKTYYLKVKALTPIHIGTGEDYEPTNFVVEEGKLYEFDEAEFYRRLDPMEKSALKQLLSQPGAEMLFAVHAFVKRHKDKAIEVAHNVVPVSKGIAQDYRDKIGKVVQNEGKGGRRGGVKKVFNQFQIARSQRLANFQELYIPGSSFKGALSTGWQEWLYRHDRKRWEQEFKELRNPTFSPMKNLLVGDLLPIEWKGEIGYTLNKERFEEDDQGPKNKLEVIREGAIFVTTVGFKSLDPKLKGSFEEMQEASNAHYGPILEDFIECRDEIFRYMDDEILERLKKAKQGSQGFLLRVGKHSGARSVTIDGIRSIKVKKSGGGPRRKTNECENLSAETTVWLYGESESQMKGLQPFGWVLCEVIDEEEYRRLLSSREERTEQEMRRRRDEAEEKRRAEEERRIREAKIVMEREAEERRQREEAAAEAARRASLSPADLLLEEHDDATLVNMMKAGEVEEGLMVELAAKIKARLQADPKTWEKAKKKALMRKEYIQQILGEK